jgi:hypothetical protein
MESATAVPFVTAPGLTASLLETTIQKPSAAKE